MEDRKAEELDLDDYLQNIAKLFLSWFINWALHNPDNSVKSRNIKYTYNV